MVFCPPVKLNSPIAFHAWLDAHFTTTKDEETLVFKDVKTNVRGAYDSSTGVFTAPLPGLYFFSVSAGTEQRDDGEPVVINLYLEDAPFAATATAGGTCTAQGTVEMQAGQEVRVVAGTQGDKLGQGLTSFSGMLVHPQL